MVVGKEKAQSDIRRLGLEVRDAMEDVDPGLVTEFTGPHMGIKLNEIGALRNRYRIAVRGSL